MSSPVIDVENLGKDYIISHDGFDASYRTLRESLASWFSRLSSKRSTHSSELFSALKDVSFQVNQGQVLGIIGRNGAGKSTLLKILSRITEPTRGRVRLRGRVASLLEVGTGFHGELTGRENVFLNGAILGMTRAEIRKKFDEIAAFSGVEQFLDTPVKRYSSGMYVRLAFAVAAHLEPDILIVDEVLAVGDAGFQKKCLGKLGEVSREGRTVLLVSHDMTNIARVCREGLLLDGGRVAYAGEMTDVIGRYFRDPVADCGYADLRRHQDRSGSGSISFDSIELLQEGRRQHIFTLGSPMTFRIEMDAKIPVPEARVAVILSTCEGIAVHCLENTHDAVAWNVQTGRHRIDIRLPELALYPGTYAVDLWVGDSHSERIDYLRKVATFDVVQTQSIGLSRPLLRSNGLVYTTSHWHHETID